MLSAPMTDDRSITVVHRLRQCFKNYLSGQFFWDTSLWRYFCFPCNRRVLPCFIGSRIKILAPNEVSG